MNVVPENIFSNTKEKIEDYVEQERIWFPSVGDFNYNLDQHGALEAPKVKIQLLSIYGNDIISFEISYIPI